MLTIEFVFLDFEAVCLAVTNDMPGGDGSKVRTDYERGRICVAIHKIATGGLGHGAVVVKLTRPFGMGHLTGMVHAVARDHGLLAARSNTHRHVTRSMPWRGFEPDFVCQLMVGLHERVAICVDDWLDGLLSNGYCRLVGEIAEVVPLNLPEQIFRLWKGRYPDVVLKHRIPTHVVGMQVGA